MSTVQTECRSERTGYMLIDCQKPVISGRERRMNGIDDVVNVRCLTKGNIGK